MSVGKISTIALGVGVLVVVCIFGFNIYKNGKYTSVELEHVDQSIDSWKSKAKEGDRLDIVIYDSDKKEENKNQRKVMSGFKSFASEYKEKGDSEYSYASIDMQNATKDVVKYDLSKAFDKKGNVMTPSIVTLEKTDGHINQYGQNIKDFENKK